ncbi:hypothetical protein EB241_12840 [Erwinia psidii]|uniref:Uncharacterized protein n=1 Tax=Erwinia psidii TaxID=69224 RepID=A0A3N6SJG7_9GAMM|nr:hypothetical protein EB241_12840 [Erwinia psidii]
MAYLPPVTVAVQINADGCYPRNVDTTLDSRQAVSILLLLTTTMPALISEAFWVKNGAVRYGDPGHVYSGEILLFTFVQAYPTTGTVTSPFQVNILRTSV